MKPEKVLYARYAGRCERYFLNFFAAIIMLTLMICFSVISEGIAAEETRICWIGLEKLQQVIEEQEPVIVDLRTPEEFRRGRITGAVNIPIEILRSNRAVLDEYKEKPLLLYCRTVNKTDLALWLIDNRGFKSIYALRGGYEAYRRN